MQDQRQIDVRLESSSGAASLRQRCRDVWISTQKIGRIRHENRMKRFERTCALERPLPAEHFIQDYAQGKEVAACIYVVPSHLFWRHVAGDAEDDTAHGVAWRRVQTVGGKLELREAEVS